MIEAALAGFFGLLIGSFLNVCIYRMPRDLSVVKPRSFCPECQHQIAWFDNIPLVSWLLLRGRCRYCGTSIPIRYPAVELITAALFMCAVVSFGATWIAAKLCVFAAIQVVLILTDLDERILPDEFTLGGTVAGAALALWVPLPWGFMQLLLPAQWDRRIVWLSEALFSAAFLSATLWSVGALYERLRHREGLGFGDVKMVAMIGAFQGLQGALLTLIIGSVLGSVAGLLYILFSKKDASTYELPFGSFLGVAALLVGFFGGPMLGYYDAL